MNITYKIYEVRTVKYDTIPDGYYYKDLVKYEFHPFDNWNDTFDTEEECVQQIKDYGDEGKTYTIQKEYYIPQYWE